MEKVKLNHKASIQNIIPGVLIDIIRHNNNNNNNKRGKLKYVQQ
jgi:hypothetical protein